MTRTNILLIVIDCLRADYAYGWRGAARVSTLDRVRSVGISFTEAIASSTITPPVFGSILTGQYPFQHRIRTMIGPPLNRRSRTVQEVLSEHGYFTCAYVSGPLFEGLGLQKGFDHYEHREPQAALFSPWGQALIEKLATRHFVEPWFILLHLWELHRPQWFLPQFDHFRYGRKRYERALSCVDDSLSRLMSALDLRRTAVIITGDHGERMFPWLGHYVIDLFSAGRTPECVNVLGRRQVVEDSAYTEQPSSRTLRMIGLWHRCAPMSLRIKMANLIAGHGHDLSEQVVRIPLVCFAPGTMEGGAVRTEQVSQVDIAPTLLELAGVQAESLGGIPGRSLVSKSRDALGRAVYMETPGVSRFDPTGWRIGARTSRYKLIRHPREPARPDVLYGVRDTGRQYREARLFSSDVSSRMSRMLDDLVGARPAGEGREAAPYSEDEAKSVRARLRALGYLE